MIGFIRRIGESLWGLSALRQQHKRGWLSISSLLEESIVTLQLFFSNWRIDLDFNSANRMVSVEDNDVRSYSRGSLILRLDRQSVQRNLLPCVQKSSLLFFTCRLVKQYF